MTLSALDETENPVDWWFIYKVPQLSPGANSDQAVGYEYVYFDSALDKAGRAIAKSPYLLSSDKGALNLTLDSVFKNSKATVGWILYNDEMPDSANHKDDGNLGHTKGVIAFDTQSGTALWLLHSWPKFVDPSAQQDPTPKYGQTYLCLSLNLPAASALAAQMADHQEPQTYLCRPASISKGDPLFALMQPLDVPPLSVAGRIRVRGLM